MVLIIRPGCLGLLEFEIEIVLVIFKMKTFLDFLDFHELRLSKSEINKRLLGENSDQVV